MNNPKVTAFYEQNSDRINEAWDNRLEEIWATDSSEHYKHVSNSEACFWEFVNELIELEATRC